VYQPILRSRAADAERHHLAWAEFPADLTSPVRLFLTLRAARRQVCLLESAEGPARLARYTFIGVDPVARFRGGPEGCRVEGEASNPSRGMGSHQALRALARELGGPAPPPGLPPFRGGWIGWFAYEWACALEPRVPRAAADPWTVPDATFDLYRDVVAFDHAAQKLYVIAAAPGGEGDYRVAMERIDAISDDLGGGAVTSGGLQLLDTEPRALVERDRYLEGVDRLRHAISQGEIFQAVLSQRFEMRFSGDPFTLYRVLRLTNPSPHMFFFEADGLTLVGSSPERLVSVLGGRAQVVPIAGTRPRHEDPDLDHRLAVELMGDVKETAEHDMLVDLARNDLGRVARLGTVAVKEHAVIEKFARVQHLVSRVECELASDFDAVDALAASFPAGTVSGAPKIRAMELLAGLEPETRGPYAGAFGYIDGTGNLDFCIAIRTMAVRDSTIHVQAGAGVVFDSVPEKEYEETLHKSRALIEAARLAASPAFSRAGAELSKEGGAR
jgi:anthranilate synthase component 1